LWTVEAHSRILEDTKRQLARTFDPDIDDPQEYVYEYLSKVGYLWEDDYLWMLRAGALRDAVTAFEVYAEKSALEVLARWHITDADGNAVWMTPFVGKRHTSPSWPTLCLIHDAMGNTLNTADVQYVLDLRHLLTHQRGELRTADLREKFIRETGARRGGPFDPWDIPLEYVRIIAMMDDLASSARACDGAIWTHTWGKEPPAKLIKLTTGSRPSLVPRQL
jgi:hypothetical protein